MALDVQATAPAAPRVRGGRARRMLAEYGGLLPATVFFGLLFVVPLGLVVAYSFWTVEDYTVVPRWNLGNYDYLFSVPTYMRTALATLWVAALATALTIAAAFPFAYWLVRYVPPRRQKLLLVLVILPFWTSYLLRVLAWIQILGEKGAVNRLLEWSGVTDQPVSLFLYSRSGVVVVLVYLYFPFAALTLYAALERFDWNQLRAAMDLGAAPGTALRRVMLPQISSGVTTAVIFVFIPILGEYLAPQLIGGASGVMIGNLVVNFFQGSQYSRGAAAALLVAALIIALLLVFRRSLDSREAQVDVG
jgi:ABC-type spermidine/putrescine transport system permease subunit I